MNMEQLADKAAEVLRPFETTNLMNTIQNFTLKQMFTNPLVLLIVAAVFFLGFIRRSKTILLTLFTLIGFIVIAHFALPAPGEELSLKGTLPFVGGGLAIGCVVIYFTLIKSD